VDIKIFGKMTVIGGDQVEGMIQRKRGWLGEWDIRSLEASNCPEYWMIYMDTEDIRNTETRG
jgi:hypothetical protein